LTEIVKTTEDIYDDSTDTAIESWMLFDDE